MKIEDDPDLVKKKDKGFLSRFGFGMKSEELSTSATDSRTGNADNKPANLEGWLEKKGRGATGSTWQKRYEYMKGHVHVQS